jgi:hypothetical protein
MLGICLLYWAGHFVGPLCNMAGDGLLSGLTHYAGIGNSASNRVLDLSSVVSLQSTPPPSP